MMAYFQSLPHLYTEYISKQEVVNYSDMGRFSSAYLFHISEVQFEYLPRSQRVVVINSIGSYNPRKGLRTPESIQLRHCSPFNAVETRGAQICLIGQGSKN
jgi:hypothetical protein